MDTGQSHYARLLGLNDSWRVESVGPAGIDRGSAGRHGFAAAARCTITAMRGLTYGRLPSTKFAPLAMNALPETSAGIRRIDNIMQARSVAERIS